MRLRPMVALPHYLLSTEEVARWLRLKVSTIRKWTCYDKIPYVKVGRRVGFRQEHIEKWIDHQNPQLKKFKYL